MYSNTKQLFSITCAKYSRLRGIMCFLTKIWNMCWIYGIVWDYVEDIFLGACQAPLARTGSEAAEHVESNTVCGPKTPPSGGKNHEDDDCAIRLNALFLQTIFEFQFYIFPSNKHFVNRNWNFMEH